MISIFLIDKIIIGYIIICYGLLKSILCLAELFIPSKYSKYIPFITTDDSFAGKFLVIIFLIFGFYSILHGLYVSEFISNNLSNIFDTYFITYVLYTLFGIILIIFYVLVVFTNINISKDMSHIITYKIGGIGSGILFFISICIIKLYDNIIYHKIQLFDFNNILLFTIILCLGFLLLFIIIKSLKQYKHNKIIHPTVLSLQIIPITALY